MTARTLDLEALGLLATLPGLDIADRMSPPLTVEERTLVEAGLARYGGDRFAALGVSAGTAAYLRTLPVGIGR